MADQQSSGRQALPLLKRVVVGAFAENCYVSTCPETNEGVIVDPGADGDRLLKEANGTQVKYILLTHGHGDHAGALLQVRSATRAPAGIHEANKGMLTTQVDINLQDGDVIAFGKMQLRVIHTPGSTCFLFPGLLISGDTLFPGGPGSTAHRLGDFPKIIESIRERLFTLRDDTLVYPGHGLHTTIGAERPHLDEWIARGW